jgi:hypothetical protein
MLLATDVTSVGCGTWSYALRSSLRIIEATMARSANATTMLPASIVATINHCHVVRPKSIVAPF